MNINTNIYSLEKLELHTEAIEDPAAVFQLAFDSISRMNLGLFLFCFEKNRHRVLPPPIVVKINSLTLPATTVGTGIIWAHYSHPRGACHDPGVRETLTGC